MKISPIDQLLQITEDAGDMPIRREINVKGIVQPIRASPLEA